MRKILILALTGRPDAGKDTIDAAPLRGLAKAVQKLVQHFDAEAA